MKSLSQMTEEELKTLCKSLESRYGENSTVTIKQSDFNNMWASIDRYAKESKYLQKQLNEAVKTTKDQELIIKKLKRRRICDNQKTEARKEHINELIAQVAKQKEEIARRGRLINELKSQRKEANKLLLDFCSNDECRFDHNGYCQEHDSCEGGYKCIQKDLKQYFEKWGVK